MEMGRLPKACSSAPWRAFKRPRDDYDHLYEEEDSDDACYDSLVPPRYSHSLQPNAGTSSLEANTFRNGQRVAPDRLPKRDTWYTDGSPLQARASTGVVNGKMRIKARTRGPQTIHRAEMYGVWIAATLAQPGDTIVLDNRVVTKAVVHTPHLESSGYDLHQASYLLVTAKQLTVRWAKGHRDPNLQNYQDRMGNELVDEEAKEGKYHASRQRRRQHIPGRYSSQQACDALTGV